MLLLWYSVTTTENELRKLVSRSEVVAKVAPDCRTVMITSWRHLENHIEMNGAVTATLGRAEETKERPECHW